MCGWGRQGGTGGWGTFEEISGKHWEMLSWSRAVGPIVQTVKEALRADGNQMPILGGNDYDLVKGERENCKTRKQTHRERKFSQHIQQIPVSRTRNRKSTKNIWKQFPKHWRSLYAVTNSGSTFLLEALLCLHWGKGACRTGGDPCVAARLWWLLCLKGKAWLLKSLMLLQVLPTSFQSPFI